MAIAFAIASGVSPEVGLITAVLGGLIVSALGGSSVQIGGPTGAFIIIVLGIIGEYGQGGLLIATLMAGILLLLMGALKLGSLIKFIPYPIILGFTAGIAVTIFTTQVNDLLGLGLTGLPKEFVPKWGVLLSSLGSIHLPTLAIGLGSILLIQLTPRLTKVVPGSLVAIIVMTIVCYLLKEYAGVTGLDTIGDRYTISSKIPDLIVPELSWATMQHLIGPAFTIALLGAIESLLSASVADGVIGERHRSNTELMAQGVANIIVPFFGGIPVTGAIARTMTNINNGARTPIAGITHALVLLLIFLFLMPLMAYIPMACLSGVLVVISYNMSGWRSVRASLRGPKSDIAVLAVTRTIAVMKVNEVPTLSAPEPYDLTDAGALIPTSLLADGHLHRFAYDASGGTQVRFIVILKNGGAYGVGLDACESCGPSGYYESDGKVICKRCDVAINPATIGFKGGCNPIPIDFTVSGGTLTVARDALESSAKVFA